MPTLNLDVVTGRTIDVSKLDANGQEQVWKLRGDVPSSILARVFYLLEIEQDQPQLPDLSAPLSHEAINKMEAEMVQYEKYHEQEALEILGAIWRWTDPQMTDEAIKAALTPAERRAVIQLFFSGLLARYGKLPSSVTSASPLGDSPSTAAAPTEAPTVNLKADPTGQASASSLTLMAPDSTPSATLLAGDLSPVASSSPTAAPETLTVLSQ